MTLDLEEAIWAVGLAAFEGGVRSPTHNAAEVELKVAIEAEFDRRIATAPSVDEALVAFGDAEVSHAHHLSSQSDAARVAAGDALRAAIATHVESEVARRQASAPGVEAALADLLGQVGCAAHHREKMADTLRSAIAAHVGTEVNRRIAVAPSVEEAIESMGLAAHHRGHVGDGSAYVRTDADREPAQRRAIAASEELRAAEAALRAAIAADRERAVASALDYHPDATAEQSARDMLERMGVDDAQSFTSGEVVELANLISLIPAGAVRDVIRPATDVVDPVLFAIGSCHDGSDLWAHMKRDPEAFRRTVSRVLSGKIKPMPSPDEARRLVEEFRAAVDTLAAHCEKEYPKAAETFRLGKLRDDARAALLRALGVES